MHKCLLGLAVFLWAENAAAFPVTVNLTGTVNTVGSYINEVPPTTPLPIQLPAVGSTVDIQLEYENQYPSIIGNPNAFFSNGNGIVGTVFTNVILEFKINGQDLLATQKFVTINRGESVSFDTNGPRYSDSSEIMFSGALPGALPSVGLPITIDSSTFTSGTFSVVYGSPFVSPFFSGTINGLAVTAIPEPPSIILFCFGIILLVMLHKKICSVSSSQVEDLAISFDDPPDLLRT